MDNVFAVIKHDERMYPQDRISVDLFTTNDLALKFAMQLVNEDVLHNGFDATIKSRYNADGDIDMDIELIKGEYVVTIRVEKKTIFKEV